jgi:hypothetical protein
MLPESPFGRGPAEDHGTVVLEAEDTFIVDEPVRADHLQVRVRPADRPG